MSGSRRNFMRFDTYTLKLIDLLNLSSTLLFRAYLGKTSTFTFLAILGDLEISIVVILFNELEKDYVWRLRLVNIQHIVWRRGYIIASAT